MMKFIPLLIFIGSITVASLVAHLYNLSIGKFLFFGGLIATGVFFWYVNRNEGASHDPHPRTGGK